MNKILIAEDDPEIGGLIARYLQKDGFDARLAGDGREALDLLEKEDFQLVVLDIMMPKTDGFEVLRQIRKKGTVPVAILSAKDRETDKIRGLELGADDYIAKPFTIGEVVARVKALLRRSQWGAASGVKVLKYGDLTLDTDSFEASVAGQPKNLTAKEFAILRLFLENPARVFTKTQIFETVWREESLSDDNTVMVHINRLRAKIEPDPANPVYIQTVWGFGYKLGGR